MEKTINTLKIQLLRKWSIDAYYAGHIAMAMSLDLAANLIENDLSEPHF